MEKYYNKLANGQVAGLGFPRDNALSFVQDKANGSRVFGDFIREPIQDPAVAEYAKNIQVVTPAATVQDTLQKAKHWINNTNRAPDDEGMRTGKSPEGFRKIFSGVKQKIAALPSNSVLSLDGATKDLTRAYSRIAKGTLPEEQLITGRLGGKYAASPLMNPAVTKWLSNVLPIAAVPQVLGANELNSSVRQRGTTGGYANWLGLNTYDPVKDSL